MADQTLQDIKDRLNIADVIAGYIPIKKAGTSYKALCPFHHEKTPSMQISPQKQIWHCFGCGEGGDIFGFVMKYENLEFKDALKILADKAGVKLPQYKHEDKGLQDEKDLLLRINDFAARYYHEVLISSAAGKPALEYLKKRGLTDGTIKQWQIGYAPDNFHALEQALVKKGVGLSDLVKAGVSSKNERGQMYDRFRGRITFPIYNYFGEAVGFSARILNDGGKSAKYVNSPETVIYNKSKILFGLNFAKEAIRKQDEAVLVEGQMDCISPHQSGFKNTVATSGTALTQQHLDQLGRLTKNLKFCFDSDKAGQAACRRAGEMALKQGFRIKVVVLKNAKDPDELLRGGGGLWEKAVKEAVWFLDYYIDLAEADYPAGSVEQKHYLSTEVVPFLGDIADPLEQDHYVRKICTKFLISEKVIREQIKKEKSGTAFRPSEAGKIGLPSGLLLEKEVLGGLLFVSGFLGKIIAEISLEDFENAEIHNLIKFIMQAGGGNISEAVSSVVAKEAVFMVESQLDGLGGNTEALERELLKTFALLKVNSIKKQQQSLQNDIKNAENLKDRQKIDFFNQKFAKISEQRIKFEEFL